MSGHARAGDVTNERFTRADSAIEIATRNDHSFPSVNSMAEQHRPTG
jgi:hypothetical protein